MQKKNRNLLFRFFFYDKIGHHMERKRGEMNMYWIIPLLLAFLCTLVNPYIGLDSEAHTFFN